MQVLIDGHDIRSLRVRRQVALVLQDPFILPITVAENIAYGRPDATLEEIVAAATAANAAQFIERLPDVYETVVGERGLTLSGGEKQRLSLARAFLKNAPILILDEPTSALDARTETLLVDALRRLMQGRTTFIIAHRLSTIRNADRILVLDHGRIVEQGVTRTRSSGTACTPASSAPSSPAPTRRIWPAARGWIRRALSRPDPPAPGKSQSTPRRW